MSYLSLKIFKQGRLVKTKIFTDDQISIGSSEGLSLQLDEISPWHVLIEKKHDVFCILDLNSETGTVLNGQKITDETPVSSGDLFRIGPYEIQFFVGPPTGQKVQPTPTKKPEETSPPAVPSFDQKEESVVSKKPSEPVAEKTSGLPPEVVSPSSVPDSPPAEAVSSVEEKISVQRPSKPMQKGFWSTYAPSSKIQNLDEFLTPSVGNLIEVIVCWKERILSTHHFFKEGDVFMGSRASCQVKFPNMLGQLSYKLLTIASGAKVYLSQGVQGLLFQGRDKSTRTSHELKGNQTVILKPYEMVKLNFNSSLKVYIRLMDKTPVAPFAGLLNLKLSESLALFLAFLLAGLLIFYGTLYAPAFLAKDTKFIEKDIRVAKVVFKKIPQPTKVVEYDLGEKKQKGENTEEETKNYKKTAYGENCKKTKKTQKTNEHSQKRQTRQNGWSGARKKATQKTKGYCGFCSSGGLFKDREKRIFGKNSGS